MISIVLPVYNEEARIRTTLQSLRQQRAILSGALQAEILVVDSASIDRTAALAADYGAELLQAPKGKLTAREVGIAHARGEIIAAVDGDSTYPPCWLGRIVGHFTNPQVAAVSGPRIYSDALLMNLVTYPWGLLFKPGFYMCGGNSAFRRAAFYETGRFYRTDQLNIDTMINEEEIAFGYRLASMGLVIKDPLAYCYTSARRWFETRHAHERQRGERF